MNIKVVNSDWIFESIKMEVCLPLDQFRVINPWRSTRIHNLDEIDDANINMSNIKNEDRINLVIDETNKYYTIESFNENKSNSVIDESQVK